MKKIALLFTILCVSQLYGMVPQYMNVLPTEMKKLIILTLAESDTLEEAVSALRSLTQTNKEFNVLVNNPIMTRALIRILADKFNAPSEYVAKKLSTRGSLNYRSLSLNLITALWQNNSTQAEDLIKTGADIDFQTADTYPMFCEPNSVGISQNSLEMNSLLMNSLLMLTQMLNKCFEQQQNIADLQNLLSQPELLLSQGYSVEQTQSFLQIMQENMQNAIALTQSTLQSTKGFFVSDEQLDQLSVLISEGKFQEVFKFIRKYNGIITYLVGDTNTCSIGAGFSLVMYAIASDQPAILEWLIKHKANLNLTMGVGDTALLMAISMGKIDMIKSLIQNGARINQQNAYEEINKKIQKMNINPRECQINISKLSVPPYDKNLYNLLDDQELQSIIADALEKLGETPVMRLMDEIDHFAEEELIELLNLLLDKGANLNLQDVDGHTALMPLVFRDGYANIMKLLLDHGANPLIKDNDGLTPLDHMQSEEYENDPEREEKIQLLTNAIKKQQKK